MLRNCADWIAEEASRYGLPLTALNPSQAQGGGRGVCQHIDLGSWGGGHVDCGSGFPMGYVLDLARGGPAQPAAKPQAEEDERMIYLEFDDEGSAPLVFTNAEADGKHRVRLACGRTCAVELDLRTVGAELGLGYDAGPQGLAIPKDVKMGAVRILEPPAHSARIAMTISSSS